MKTINKTSPIFQFVSVGAITENIKPVSWLIHDYLESHTLSLLFGDPASGKSFVAIDMACSIATGHAWHEHDVEKGAVFYIAGEGHNGLGKRFKAWEVHNGVDISQSPLFVAERPAQLFDKENALAVSDAVEELSIKHGVTPKLIIIDTLARNFGGADENSTKDMNQFVTHVDELKDRWKATTLIVHHSGHSDKQRARGAMALKGALDHEYRAEKISDNVLTLTNTKMKDGETPEPKNFEFITVELPSDNNAFKFTSAILSKTDAVTKTRAGKRLSPQRQRALDIFRNCLIDLGKKRQIRQGMVTVNSVQIDEFKEALRIHNIVSSDKADNIRRGIARVIDDLNNQGITSSYSNYIWLTDKTDETGGQ